MKLYTYINRHAGTTTPKQRQIDTMNLGSAQFLLHWVWDRMGVNTNCNDIISHETNYSLTRKETRFLQIMLSWRYYLMRSPAVY